MFDLGEEHLVTLISWELGSTYRNTLLKGQGGARENGLSIERRMLLSSSEKQNPTNEPDNPQGGGE